MEAGINAVGMGYYVAAGRNGAWRGAKVQEGGLCCALGGWVLFCESKVAGGRGTEMVGYTGTIRWNRRRRRTMHAVVVVR